MAQLMRPISTVTDQGNFTGATAHGSVDGTAPDTGDYWNGNDNQDDILEVLLTDLSASAPGSGTCTVSIYETVSDTNSAPAAGGSSVTYDLEVYQATTQIAARTGITPTDSTFTLDNNLTFAASAVTDWADVRVRFTSYGTGGSPAGRRGAATSYIDISTPDAAPAADNLLADNVESASELTSPAITQEHGLLAADVESASELTAPVLGQEHALTATSVESASEVSTPLLAITHTLTANNVESASDVTAPAIGQEHALTVTDVESASEVSAPALTQAHVLQANSVESASELTAPVLTAVLGTDVLLADNVESASEVSAPAVGQVHVLLSISVESESEVSAPILAEVGAGGGGASVSMTGEIRRNVYLSVILTGEVSKTVQITRNIYKMANTS